MRATAPSCSTGATRMLGPSMNWSSRLKLPVSWGMSYLCKPLCEQAMVGMAMQMPSDAMQGTNAWLVARGHHSVQMVGHACLCQLQSAANRDLATMLKALM